MAYQFAPKWVARAGFAVCHAQVAHFADTGGGNSLGMGFNSIAFSNPAFAEPGVALRNGLSDNVNELTFASYNSGIRRSNGQINSPPALLDPNAVRPYRMANWNFSLQREFGSSLVRSGLRRQPRRVVPRQWFRRRQRPQPSSYQNAQPGHQ